MPFEKLIEHSSITFIICEIRTLRMTKPGINGELQITDALLEQAKLGRVIGYKFKGIRYDCGSIDGFVKATNDFYKRSQK